MSEPLEGNQSTPQPQDAESEQVLGGGAPDVKPSVDSNGNPVNGDDEKKVSEGAPRHINLKVTDNNTDIFFKIKDTTQLKRLMEAFAKRLGCNVDSLRFMADGVRVEAENTPRDLDLEDGDVIEAHREQIGGASF
ncbi:uncharacterized protein LODBEIA_P02080 [Lodderomyces beijingensis]|uniref:Ubiquitin-like domain-containing protein n=1 Tax=Lodderomyces beijingensis TaxID=1775926 RepID=A0ABP0ZCR7_9ASCO